MAELATLMVRYCDGEAAAFRELYALVAPPLCRYLVRLARERTRADDLLQITFMKVHRARATYIRGADPAPWIFAIAHRTFLDDHRRQRRAVVRIADDGEPPFVTCDLEGNSAARGPGADPDLVASALDALATLPPRLREAVVLTKLDGKTIAQAAAIAGTTEGAMRVRAHRAYAVMRRLICLPTAGMITHP